MDQFDALLQIRLSLGLTQTQMAQRMGMERRTFMRYEHGESRMPLHVKLAAQHLFREGRPGERIKFIREELGLTQFELGKKLFKTAHTIGKYERGSLVPPRTVELAVQFLLNEVDEGAPPDNGFTDFLRGK